MARAAAYECRADRPDETHLSGAIRPWSPDRRRRPARFLGKPSRLPGHGQPEPSVQAGGSRGHHARSNHGRLRGSRGTGGHSMPSTSRDRKTARDTSSRRRAPASRCSTTTTTDASTSSSPTERRLTERRADADAPTGHLYRNLGGLRFDDVTDQGRPCSNGMGPGRLRRRLRQRRASRSVRHLLRPERPLPQPAATARSRT